MPNKNVSTGATCIPWNAACIVEYKRLTLFSQDKDTSALIQNTTTAQNRRETQTIWTSTFSIERLERFYFYRNLEARVIVSDNTTGFYEIFSVDGDIIVPGLKHIYIS